MARLMATIDDDRSPYRWGRHSAYATHSERVSRLADQWSEVTVKTWDIRVAVKMEAGGSFIVVAQDLVTGQEKSLALGDVETLFSRTPPKRAASDGRILTPKARKSRLTAAQKRELATVNQLFGVSA